MKIEKIKNKTFKKLALDICQQIEKSGWQPDYIVGLTRGGLVPAVYLSHYFDVPMNTLKISLRDHEDMETNCWMSEDSYDGKNILIVDDINDTGATINWIMEDWRSTCHPNEDKWNTKIWNHNVKFAVLVDNLSSKCNVKMDFCGMEINKANEDVWIEFPWEGFSR